MFEASAPGREGNQFTEANIILGVVSFLCLEYVWELFLKIRQLLVIYKVTTVPDEFRDSLTQEAFERSRLYNLERSCFTIFQDFVMFVLKCSAVASRGHAHVWNSSAGLMRSIGYDPEGHEILRSCVAVGVADFVNYLTFTPFKMFETFVLERRYDLTTQSVFGFFKGQLKLSLLTLALLEPMVAGIVFIVKQSGPNVLQLWLYTIAMMFTYVTVYPHVIAPLLDSYVHLNEGELLPRIRNMCHELGIPSPNVFVFEGPKRATNNQLSVTSSTFGNIRIEIDCNIIKGYKNASGTIDVGAKGLNDDNLVSLIVHELAHLKLNHLVKKSAILQGTLLLDLFIFSHLYQYEVIYSAFGFSDQPIIMGFLITLEILLAPYHLIGHICMTTLNRRFEMEADQFTKDLGFGVFLRKAIITLAKDNLIFPVCDPLYAMWFEKSPCLRDRVKAL